MQLLADSTSSDGWVVVKKEINLNRQEFLALFKSALELGADDSLLLIKTFQNENGVSIIKFQQLYKK